MLAAVRDGNDRIRKIGRNLVFCGKDSPELFSRPMNIKN